MNTIENKVVITPIQFGEMRTKEIISFLRNHPDYYIDGEKVGVDRCIRRKEIAPKGQCYPISMMKRYIVINSSKTALIISDSLAKSISQVCKETEYGDEVYAFDTHEHLYYSYKVVKNGFHILPGFGHVRYFKGKIMDNEKFKTFVMFGEFAELYKEIIMSVISIDIKMLEIKKGYPNRGI